MPGYSGPPPESAASYRERAKNTFATVDDIIAMLKKVSDSGKGKYLVGCNEEYWLARKGDACKVNDKAETVDLGGYSS